MEEIDGVLERGVRGCGHALGVGPVAHSSHQRDYGGHACRNELLAMPRNILDLMADLLDKPITPEILAPKPFQ